LDRGTGGEFEHAVILSVCHINVSCGIHIDTDRKVSEVNAPPPSQEPLRKIEAPAPMGDHRTTPGKVSFFQRLGQHPKVTFAVAAIVSVAAVAVTIMVTSRTSPGPPIATQTPTTEPSATYSPTAQPTTTTASSGPKRWEPDQQMIVDAFPQLLPPTPDGKGFGDAPCTGGTDRYDNNNPTLHCGPYYDSSKPSFTIECNPSREPITSDSNPFGKIPMEKLVSSQRWTKPSGSGQINRYDDPYGWRKMYIRFDGARSFCSMSADSGVSVIEAWWSAVPI
jgi:hypothetical protein